ncbi:MAG: hypothetical protein M0Z77_02795 [Thermoplasmatales archaeon]|nr:hypothetical protein [Thermoplasmatales archaeon]
MKSNEKCSKFWWNKSSRYISGKSKDLNFIIPEMKIVRVECKDFRSRIVAINPAKRKELGINKSTPWYQHRKTKVGKEIKFYEKTRVRME